MFNKEKAHAALYKLHPKIWEAGSPENLAFVSFVRNFGEQAAYEHALAQPPPIPNLAQPPPLLIPERREPRALMSVAEAAVAAAQAIIGISAGTMETMEDIDPPLRQEIIGSVFFEVVGIRTVTLGCRAMTELPRVGADFVRLLHESCARLMAKQFAGISEERAREILASAAVRYLDCESAFGNLEDGTWKTSIVGTFGTYVAKLSGEGPFSLLAWQVGLTLASGLIADNEVFDGVLELIEAE